LQTPGQLVRHHVQLFVRDQAERAIIRPPSSTRLWSAWVFAHADPGSCRRC
jgi:hypothetical protein